MKEKDHRRSLRQAEILIQLDEKPAKTITDLAERMNAQRPSISRSLNLLKEQGLVLRDRKGWHLTETGGFEASTARDTLIEMGEKVKNIAVRTNEIWGRIGLDMAKTVAQITPPLDTTKMVAQLIPSLDTSEVWGRIGLDMAKTAAQITPPLDTGKIMVDAIKPLIEAQGLNSALLGNLTGPMYLAGIYKLVKENNLYLANAIDNILTIQQTEMAQLAAQVSNTINFSWISTHLVSVNRSFEQLFRYQMEKINVPSLSTISLSLAEEIILPTATVTYYTDSLRNFVEAETETDIPPLPDQGFEEIGDQTLDPLLHELNPDFVEMRLGSWSVLQVRGPDRLRQAATSQRELLSQLLKSLIPNIQLPEDQREGPQVKARVKIALQVSQSDAEFIDAIVQAVYSYYNQLNKYTHHNQKHEESLRALLHTGEGLIRFILAKMSKKL